MSCQICTEKFNKTTRKPISCPKCNEIFCVNCVQTYVLSDNLVCLSCKTEWDYDFLISQLSKKFLNTDFKQVQQKKLFDIERSLLPETIYFVELLKRKENLIKEKKEISQAFIALHEKLMKIDDDIEFCLSEVHGKAATKYVPKIIGGCPSENCRGFIDRENFTCGLCNTIVCGKCREILKDGKDAGGAAEAHDFSKHECLEANVESMKLLMKECKPCPKCSALIYKIEGCDQMFCVQCNTAFSWKTGLLETGRIHNPHYYDWIRQNNNGEVPREREDINPQELIPFYMLRMKFNENENENNSASKIFLRKLSHLHRNLTHILEVILRELRYDRNNNKDLRIQYLLGTLSEEQFKSTLEIRFRMQKRNTAIANCLQLFYDVLKDNFQNLYNASFRNLAEFISQYSEIATFTNENIAKIEKTYKCALTKYKVNSEF